MSSAVIASLYSHSLSKAFTCGLAYSRKFGSKSKAISQRKSKKIVLRKYLMPFYHIQQSLTY
jgi:hypothetical protein